MKSDAQNIVAMNGLVDAVCNAAVRGGKGKTWRMIATFKARKVLRGLLNRAPKNDEVARVLKPLAAIKPASNGHVKPASRPARRVKRNKRVRSTTAAPRTAPRATAPKAAPKAQAPAAAQAAPAPAAETAAAAA
jgi:hypothetical protein